MRTNEIYEDNQREKRRDPSFHSESLLTLSVWTEKEKIVEILDILKRKNKSWEMCHWKRRFQETANN